jgi:hypothetical protein
LWSKETGLKVYDKYQFGKWGMIVEEATLDANVKAISMNYLLKKYNIEFVDILKLDIEASEKKLFTENFKEWLPKIKMIVIIVYSRRLI